MGLPKILLAPFQANPALSCKQTTTAHGGSSPVGERCHRTVFCRPNERCECGIGPTGIGEVQRGPHPEGGMNIDAAIPFGVNLR